MLLDLKFSIGTLGIGAGTFIAALYGMNLKSFIEESDFGFPLVSLSCFVLSVIACVYGLRKLRRVQRISMWGEGDVSGHHPHKVSGPDHSPARSEQWWQRRAHHKGRDCDDVPPKRSWADLDNDGERSEQRKWRNDLEKLQGAYAQWPDPSGGPDGKAKSQNKEGGKF